MAFLLVLASIAGQLSKFLLGHDRVYGLVPLFYVDAEQNIPTFFSALLLFCAALLLMVITVLKKKQKDRDVSKWAILALGFLYMAVDEATSIHEKLIRPARGLLGSGPFGIFHPAWVMPGIAVVFVLTLFFLRFLLRLPAKTRSTFIVAGTLFVVGALCLELVGGHYDQLYGDNITYRVLAHIEESFEMGGVIVFIYALLKYMADNYKEVRFRFDNFEGTSQSKASET